MEIDIIDIGEIKIRTAEFEDITILINSNRLDNFISEIAKISRSKTDELLDNEKVYLNSKLETKPSKEIREGDIIVIRGKGKFKINKFQGLNKKGKQIIEIKKYV